MSLDLKKGKRRKMKSQDEGKMESKWVEYLPE
jgi:hypothetical protein